MFGSMEESTGQLDCWSVFARLAIMLEAYIEMTVVSWLLGHAAKFKRNHRSTAYVAMVARRWIARQTL